MSDWSEEWVRLVRAAAGEAVSQVGDELLAEVRKNTPVRTGRLQGAWRIDRFDDDGRTIVNETEYAAAVEYGSLGRAGAGMAGRAVAALQGRLGRVFDRALNREVTRLGKRTGTGSEVDR